MVRVDSIEGAEGVLTLRCSGTIGIGSESVPTCWPINEAIVAWIHDHPDHPVKEVVADLTDVDYEWGDGPMTCMIPLLRHGVERVQYVGSARSAPALETLIRDTNMSFLVTLRRV